MTTDKQKAKADDYLASGRVCVVEVSTKDGYGEFLIVGKLPEPYRATYQSGQWACDCPARVAVCAHVLACQTITKFEAVAAIVPDENHIVSFTKASDASMTLDDLLKG